MRTIALTVNARPVTADVEPRMHLADFLRERLLLTGTHIGCEHGICGACTVVIDGEIARSCITYAVQCDGAEITTIEGFAEDPLMARLRAAFTMDHALQCGFCTPGMIIAARDLIRRKGRLDRQQIRQEMSGNLCRCTGYMGMVAAIGRVMAEAGDHQDVSSATSGIGPAPGPGATPARPVRRDAVGRGPAEAAGERLRPDVRAPFEDISEEGLITLADSFAVRHPPDRVWDVLSDLPTVAGCLPGARLTAQDGDRISGEMRLKLGPMSPRFAGDGRVRRHDRSWRAQIVVQARDARSASRARGRIDYALVDTGDGGTRVEVEIGYALSGTLAQFSRGAIATGLVRRLTSTFATNLEAAIAGEAVMRREEEEPQALDAAGLLGTVLRARIRGWLRTLFGHRE